MINRFQWLVVFAVLSTFSSDATAGPFRRYPSGSARSQRVRIANALPETPGGMVTATPDGLPPLPPDDESGSNSSSYMNALEQAPGPPVAAVETANDSLTEWWESMHGGDGLYFEYVYTGEFYNNTRGGLSTDGATKYRGNIDIVMTAELDELGIEDGGTFFFYAQNGHGRALTNNHVGDFQVYSNIDSPDFVQVSEFWYERDLFEGFLAVRVGKQDANAEFAVVDLGGDFVNSSFGVSPTIPLPTFPLPTMGVTTFWQLSEELSFKAGVFDGGSTLDEWGFSDEGHAFSIFELKSTHEIGKLPGDVHAGIWYHGGVFDDLPTGGTVKGNHGVYLGADQMIWRENACDEDDDQGIGVFAQYGWVPEDRNELRYHLGAGIVWKGLVDDRDDDLCQFAG